MDNSAWGNELVKTPKTIAEQVYNLLKSKIIAQEIKPGEVLLEIPVSNALGVSRTPVREAFSLLQHDNLVCRSPKGGVSVTELTVKELLELTELRTLLEVHSIELTCDRITEAELEELEATVQEIDKVFNSADLNNKLDLIKLSDLNAKFHDILYKAGDGYYLTKLIEIIRLPVQRYRPFSLETKKQRERSWQEHKMIIKHLRNRDKTKLKRLIKKHIKDAGNAIANSLDEQLG